MKYFVSYPSSDALNPFVKILNGHLEVCGWQEKKDNVWMKPFRLFSKRKEIQLMYFHWPESLWRDRLTVKSIIKAILFIVYLSFAKKIGIKLVFSGHNVLPHYDSGHRYLEIYMRKWIIRNFDLIIGHSLNTKDDFEEMFHQKLDHYVLALHGLYDEYYRCNSNKEEARLALGLPLNDYIILLHYNHNPYKGSLAFLKSWITEGIDKFLLVIGNPSQDFLDLIAEYDNYKIINESNYGIKGFLSDQTLVSSIIASDFVALPYEEITTSGAYFLSISFNKPVIAPDLVFFKLHTLPQSAILYDSVDRLLTPAFSKIDAHWVISETALTELKDKFSWKKNIKNIVDAFNKLVNHA